jgi:preprotein translocase subunit YajC
VTAAIFQLVSLAVLGAPDATGAPAPGPGGDSSFALLQSLLPFIAIFALFYFLLIRPQRREQARRQDMLAAIKKNDRVLTAGGIYGVVTNVRPEADEVTVKVDEATNTKLRMTLSSITRVVGDESSEESASPK